MAGGKGYLAVRNAFPRTLERIPRSAYAVGLSEDIITRIDRFWNKQINNVFHKIKMIQPAGK